MNNQSPSPSELWIDVLDSEGIGACTLDPDLSILAANSEAHRILGSLGHDPESINLNGLSRVAGWLLTPDRSDTLTLDSGDTRVTVSSRRLDAHHLVLTLKDHRTSDLIRSLSAHATIGDFASSIAHRLNNSLTVVLGQAELLSILHDLDPDSTTKLDAIRNQGGQAAELARRVQRLGRDLHDETPIRGLKVYVEACLKTIDQTLTVEGDSCASPIDLTRGLVYRVVASSIRHLRQTSPRPIFVHTNELAASHKNLPEYLAHTRTPWTLLSVCADRDVSIPAETETDDEDNLGALVGTLKRNGCHLHSSSVRFDLFIPHRPNP